MKADVLRRRLVEVLNSWLTEEGFEALGPANVLEAQQPPDSTKGAPVTGVRIQPSP